MPDTEHDQLMRNVEKLRLRVGRVEEELIELHNTIRFDDRTPAIKDRALRIESELQDLGTDVRHLREEFEGRG